MLRGLYSKLYKRFYILYPKYNNTVDEIVYDSDAQAFFTSAGITNTIQKNAVNQFVLDLKSYSIWTKFYALYPFVGGNASAHSYNLINPATYQITWYGGVTHDSDGIIGNGVDARGDTGLNDASVTSIDNYSFGMYSRTDIVETSVDIGVADSSLNSYSLFYTRRNSGGVKIISYSRFGTATTTSNSDSLGLFHLSRLEPNLYRIYKNGTNFLSSTTVSLDKANYNYNILTRNIDGAYATYSTRNLALAFIAQGFTQAQMVNFNTAVTTFQTALSRNV